MAQPAKVLQAEQITVKLFRFREIVHRNRPMCHSFDFQ